MSDLSTPTQQHGFFAGKDQDQDHHQRWQASTALFPLTLPLCRISPYLCPLLLPCCNHSLSTHFSPVLRQTASLTTNTLLT
eukprot:3621654-Ditylum_brightwellii.AAC.1